MRAKYIAENFLENPVRFNSVRGMLGFTGTYKGQKISVMGTGMGLPTTSIYVTELIRDYGVKNLIRVGSCGSIQEDVKVRDVILVQGSCTDSSMNRNTFKGKDFAPISDFGLLHKAFGLAKDKDLPLHVGNIMATDTFYNNEFESWRVWKNHGVLAYEMESTALFTIAAYYGAKALTILTVSDSILTHEETTAEEREKTFTDMMELALDTLTE